MTCSHSKGPCTQTVHSCACNHFLGLLLQAGLCAADAVLAERGEVAVSLGELTDLRALAANGADTAELARETASLISLLHEARSSNAQVSQATLLTLSPTTLSGFSCRFAVLRCALCHKHCSLCHKHSKWRLNLFGQASRICHSSPLRLQCLRNYALQYMINTSSQRWCLSILHEQSASFWQTTDCASCGQRIYSSMLFMYLQLRRERDRLRYKLNLFKKTLSNELLTMQLPNSNASAH